MGEKDKLFWESRLTRQNFLESELKTFSKRSRSNLTGVKASPLLTLHLTGKGGGGGGGTTGATKNKVKLDLNLETGFTIPPFNHPVSVEKDCALSYR